MNATALRNLQQALAALGLYNGPIDGRRSANLDAASAAHVTAHRAECTGDPATWSAARTVVAAYQLVLKDAGTPVGDIDGLWGTMTGNAHVTYEEIRRFGQPILFRDEPTGSANPNGWPVDDVPAQAGMRAFYGPNGIKNGFTPPMQMVDCPWTLRLSWDLSARTRRIGCHPKVAPSLGRVLQRVFAEYGEARIKDLRLDIYGGCYNPRPKQGGTTWSTHAWGVALDFDPENNQLRWGRDRATFARPDYDVWWRIWESEGWVSLGRTRNFDWMHVQAARLA